MVDREYPGRVLIAEANQWPQEVVAFFGTEDEPELIPFRLNRLMAAWNARLEALLAARGAGFAQWRVVMVLARGRRALNLVELAALTLTPHGRACYREWLRAALEEAEAGLSALRPSERATLLRLMGKLEAAVAPVHTSESIA